MSSGAPPEPLARDLSVAGGAADADEARAGTSSAPVTLVHAGARYPSDCIDGAIVYTSPLYWIRVTVTGPPGGEVRKFNQHVSCPNSVEYEDLNGPDGWNSRYRIPPSGVLVIDYYQPQALDCRNSLLGRWKSRVEVDGRPSNEVYVTEYNSACAGPVDGGPNPSTCTQAASFCAAGP